MELTGKHRRYLRALAHELSPVVIVGKDGLTGAVFAAVERALLDHELIKVKLGERAGADRHAAATELATATHSEVAQVLGNIVLLYKAHPETPSLKLPSRPR